MSLEMWLQRWVSASLLTAVQAERILAFERADASMHAHAHVEQRPTLLYAITGLGALAVAVGVLSIVAANWDAIPPRAKVGVDLGLVAVLGLGVWHWERRGPGWARESAIVILWGVVLASIALVGQVYQLGGHADEALLAWSVLTAPLLTRARSGTAAMLWILGLQVTAAVWAVRLAEDSTEARAIATIYWVPLVCLAIGRLPGLRRLRPALATTLTSVGWGELVLCATLGTFAFYMDTSREDWSGAFAPAMVSAAVTAAIAATSLSGLAPRLLLLACFALAHVPLFAPPGQLELAAAASFLALWLLVAWAAHHHRDAGLLNVATAIIGLRIVAIYFEVFGTLLDTGMGLVSGGVLTLVLAWLWAHKRRQFAAELAGRGTT